MRGLQKGLAAFTPSIRLVGAALWIAWITIIYTGDPLMPGVMRAYSYSSVNFLISTFSLAACLIACSLFPALVQTKLENKRLMLVLALVGSAASFVVACADLVLLPLFCLASVATGIVTSFIALRCAVLYSDIDTKNALINMCLMLVTGTLVYSFASMMIAYDLAAVVVFLLCTLLPFAVFFLYLPEPDTENTGTEPFLHYPQSFWRLILCITLLMFCFCTVRGYYPNFVESNQFTLSRAIVASGLIVGSLIIGGIAAALPRNSSYGSLCYYLFLISLVAMPFPTLLGIGTLVSGSLASILFGVSLVCTWGLLARVSFRTGSSAIRVFGLGFGLACLATASGFLFGSWLYGAGIDSSVQSWVSLLFVTACIIAAVFLLRKEDLARLMQPRSEALEDANNSTGDSAEDVEGSDERTPHASKNAPFQAACRTIAEEYGLSPRETDVFHLMARGKDAKTIAEELYVSFNTARTHIRKIYTKLDVHSRHELMKLIDNKRDDR